MSFFELLSSFNKVLTVHFNSGFSDSSKFSPLGTFIIEPMVFGGEYTILVFHIAFVYSIKSGHLELVYLSVFLSI